VLLVRPVEEGVRSAGVADDPMFHAGPAEGSLERRDGAGWDRPVVTAEEPEHRTLEPVGDVHRRRDIVATRAKRKAIEADDSGQVEPERRGHECQTATEAEADREEGAD